MVAGGLCGLALNQVAGADVVPRPLADPVQAVGGLTPATSTSVTLTDTQKAQADAVIASDPFLKSLLIGKTYTTKREGPWTHIKDTGVIGVIRDLQLSSSLTSTANFPAIDYDVAEALYPYYSRHVVNLTISNATVLTVLVDLTTNTVVSVEPDLDATIDTADLGFTSPVGPAD